jgi:hypothetical protein
MRDFWTVAAGATTSSVREEDVVVSRFVLSLQRDIMQLGEGGEWGCWFGWL